VFLWALFAFGVGAGQDTSALVPMADMLNHKYPAETYWTFGMLALAAALLTLATCGVFRSVQDSIYNHVTEGVRAR
jgi:hypothetical protein